MIHIELTNTEKRILKDYFRTTTVELIRLKAQAILLKSKLMKSEDIADVLDRDKRTIRRWVHDFHEIRLASIFSGQIHNENANKLTRTQKEEIKQVLSQSPHEHGLPKDFWDVPQLKQYIWTRFDVVYESERAYHFLLEFGNLSFKQPDRFNIKRNEKQIEERMEEIYGEIVPLLEDPAWEIFCSDEMRMQLEAITRRAWLKKGKKTVLKVERSKDYQNYMGFLNQRTFQCHVFEIVWGKSDEIIRATGELLKQYPDKKICIIWDNATCHKGKLMQQALSAGGILERVHLIALPPYAPDCNPIEHVWNTTKGELSNHQDKTFEETKRKFMNLTHNQFFHYQI